MKKILILWAIVLLPKYQPMFDGMIVRCDENRQCHWECEFGVATSTVMVNDNLIVKASACNEPPQAATPLRIYQNNFIPTGSHLNFHTDSQ